MSYPTQEDELRAKEVYAEDKETAEESRFLSTFQHVPIKNTQRLTELSSAIVNNFNAIMDNARQQPFERQEQIMVGMKKLFEEEVQMIDARRNYVIKINPSTAEKV